MNPLVLTLEDTPDRVIEMRRVLAETLPGAQPMAFDNAPEFVAALQERLPYTILICLDHDLGPSRALPDGQRFDPGSGRDAADALAAWPAVCPVIVHSTNAAAVPGMIWVLSESGWTCSAVTPFDELNWIETAWRGEVDRYKRLGLLHL